MPAQVASQVATVDWNIVAGAVATFVITIVIAWTGRQQGKKKVEAEEKRDMPAIMSGVTLQDNYSLLMSAEATRALTEAIKDNTRSNERNHDQMIELRIEIERLARKLSP